MKSVEEIIALWKEMGITNLEDYRRNMSNRAWFDDNIENFKKFDANVIDGKLFWQAAEICFGTHPVASTSDDDIKICNSNNHQLAVQSGAINMFSIIDYNFTKKNIKASIAEIGCGYGSFNEHYIKPNNIEAYDGFDIVARCPWAIEIDGLNGSFSDEQLEKYVGKYNIIYSVNVFQHLNRYQIIKYLKQIYKLLQPGGYFILGYCDSPNNTSFQYGQFVELLPLQVLQSTLRENGFYCCASASIWSSPGLRPHSFLLQKLEEKTEEVK